MPKNVDMSSKILQNITLFSLQTYLIMVYLNSGKRDTNRLTIIISVKSPILSMVKLF